MEELHSSWKIPTIAYFCYALKEELQLYHFEIEELEESFLGKNDLQYCATLEQLIIKLLEGYTGKEILHEQWEETLKEVLNKEIPRSKKDSNYIGDFTEPFNELSVQQKINILYELCQIRLDTEDASYILNNMDSDKLRVESVVTDSEKNVYYYFFGTRLYKEDLKIKETSKKTIQKKIVPEKPLSNNSNRRTSNRKCTKTEESSPCVVSSPWSIVCHTTEDWENLIQKFKKSKNDKNVGEILEEFYLTTVTDDINIRQKQLFKKRQCEFGPRRTSDRIKLRRHLQDSKPSEETEKEQEEKKTVDPKQLEEEEKAKRAAEKLSAIKERAERAKLRDLQKQKTVFEENYPNFGLENIRTISPIKENKGNLVKVEPAIEKRVVRKLESKQRQQSEQQMKLNSDLPPEKKTKCVSNLNMYKVIQPKPLLQFQNIVSYTPCAYQKAKNPLVVLERVPQNVRTYSKLDQRWLQDNKVNTTPDRQLSQSIQYNFLTKITSPTIIRPVPLHRQFCN